MAAKKSATKKGAKTYSAKPNGEAAVAEGLRIDYAVTTRAFKHLSDVRFRLLVLVPAFSVFAITFLFTRPYSVAMLVVGLLGFAAILGLALYAARNQQNCNAAMFRAKRLEKEIGFRSFVEEGKGGGLFLDGLFHGPEPSENHVARPDRGSLLVYGASLGAWTFVVSRSSLALFFLILGLQGEEWAAFISALLSIGAGFLVFILLMSRLSRYGGKVEDLSKLPEGAAAGSPPEPPAVKK